MTLVITYFKEVSGKKLLPTGQNVISLYFNFLVLTSKFSSVIYSLLFQLQEGVDLIDECMGVMMRLFTFLNEQEVHLGKSSYIVATASHMHTLYTASLLISRLYMS